MNTVVENIVHKYQGIAPGSVIAAVKNAAARTGADFSYLMDKAATESSFDPKAAAKGSSAKGLFQFIESTWLGMVKQYGEKFGLGAYAEQIDIKDGKPCVDDCAVKDTILKLRNNPEIAALMAGAYSSENKAYLESHTDAKVGPTELYLAHFLGAGGAAKFLNARQANGDSCAADILPQAAHANKNVFTDKATGQPRSLDDIYALFADKFDDAKLKDTAACPASPVASSGPVVRAPAAAAPPRAAWQAPLHSTVPNKLSPAMVMAMADMQDNLLTGLAATRTGRKDRFGYNG